MITQNKLNVYRHINGDVDGLYRTGSPAQHQTMQPGDWNLIESLIQDINLVDKGLTSEEYAKSVEEKLSQHTDSKETIEQLKILASR